MESLPNIEFWRRFPSLVRDGARFTWWTVTGQGNMQLDTYSDKLMDNEGDGGGDFRFDRCTLYSV